MAQPKIIADFETQLASAISVGSTSFSLASATDDDGVALPSGLYYFTVDNGQSNKEYLSGTLSGTSVTSVVTVSRQGTETSGAARVHRIGASVIISDFATYKKYIDNVIISGAPDASTTVKGLSEISTSTEIDSDSATGATGAPIAITPDQLVLSKYGTRLPSATEKSVLTGILNSTYQYAADAGASDSYAVSPTPAYTAYTAGMMLAFKANTVNTGAASLNVNSLGAKTIVKNYNVTLSDGDIKAGQIVHVIYDGTNFQMLSTPSSALSLLAAGSVTKNTSATTTTTIAHGLGVTPKIVRMFMATNSTSTGICYANSTYLSATSSQYSSTVYLDGSSGTDFGGNQSFGTYAGSLDNGINGSITVDATNITITWSAIGGGTFSGSAYITWEAQA